MMMHGMGNGGMQLHQMSMMGMLGKGGINPFNQGMLVNQMNGCGGLGKVYVAHIFIYDDAKVLNLLLKALWQQHLIMPGMQAGMMPGMHTSVMPGMQAGIMPGMQAGIMPGMQTSIMPGTQTGIMPGMIPPGMQTGMGMMPMNYTVSGIQNPV